MKKVIISLGLWLVILATLTWANMPTMMSAESSAMTFASAQNYCNNLVAAPAIVYEGGSDSTSYNDWRMPSIQEASIFLGLTGTNTDYLWVDTPYLFETDSSDPDYTPIQYDGVWVILRLSDGYWGNSGYNGDRYVRCVR